MLILCPSIGYDSSPIGPSHHWADRSHTHSKARREIGKDKVSVFHSSARHWIAKGDLFLVVSILFVFHFSMRQTISIDVKEISKKLLVSHLCQQFDVFVKTTRRYLRNQGLVLRLHSFVMNMMLST